MVAFKSSKNRFYQKKKVMNIPAIQGEDFLGDLNFQSEHSCSKRDEDLFSDIQFFKEQTQPKAR